MTTALEKSIKLHNPNLIDSIHQDKTYIFNTKDAEHLLRRITSHLTFLKTNWKIGFGTLLGLYRDQQLIPYDTDVDILLPASSSYEITLRHLSKLENEEIYSTRLISNAVYSLYYKNVYIDLYYYHNIPNSTYSGCGAKERWFKTPTSFLDTTEYVRWKDSSWPAPSPIEQYLIQHYGPDWKTPKINCHAPIE